MRAPSLVKRAATRRVPCPPVRAFRSALRVISSKYNLTYIELTTGFELYDLSGTLTGVADPYQLNNSYSCASARAPLNPKPPTLPAPLLLPPLPCI